MANILDLTVAAFTTDQLSIKVQNTSGASLDKRLVMEFYPPAYLVDDRINQAAIAAASSEKPPGAKSLAGIVTGPEGWSIWARREASDSSLIIVLINDMDQNGSDLPTPVKFPAGAGFVIDIPLDPGAERALVDLLYSYQHGKNESDPYFYGKLELKPERIDWTPNVKLGVRHDTPTMINPGDLVKVYWEIQDGVSATLRGPLPGGNSELTLSPNPSADFTISEGYVDVRVMGAMTYMLQAEVKRPGHPNVNVVRMLSLDTPNHKYTYVYINPEKVLPHGLLEINWAAWGVKQVELNVYNREGTHTTRTIPLTQQTKGRFFEGSGVMRVSASKTNSETVDLLAPPIRKESTTVSVVSWQKMLKPDVSGGPLGMAILLPKLGVLTSEGLFLAHVGEVDPETAMQKLMFTKVSRETPKQWLGLAAVEKRFVALRRTNQDDLEVAPYKIDGSPDEILPLTLPDLRTLLAQPGTTFDFVAFRGRVYLVVETGLGFRRAFSVGFNDATKKAEQRSEPLLETLAGYRLVTFDDALYALNRSSGRMFRFGLTDTGTLDEPRVAASAIKENDNGTKESMIRQGLFAPVGRVLAVLSPSSVPTLKALERFGLHNVLGYLGGQPAPDPNSIPQDLFYNPQKNYWARCGHDLDIKQGAVAAFRPTGSRRLWVIQPDTETHTLPVGSETLFAHDFVPDVSTAALPPYLDKQREFKISNATGINVVAISENYRAAGLTTFSGDGPAQLMTSLPDSLRKGASATFQLRYNEADPAPVHVRFMVERAPGVKYDYLLEVTFSGPNLSNATSVFKRIAVDAQGGLSLAEIPGTTIKYTTDKPVMVPEPILLYEGVRLRVHNLTTYPLWQRTGATESVYTGAEIKITYTTRPISFFAYGAGELHVDIDFSLPLETEISSGSEPQRKLMRINTDRSKGLYPEINLGSGGFRYDFMVRYTQKSDVNAVYVGDGVATERGEAIYLPVAFPEDQLQTQILKINPENLSFSASEKLGGAGVFALPNEVAVTSEFVIGMFGGINNLTFLMDQSLRWQTNLVTSSYSVTNRTKYTEDGDYCLLAMKEDKTASLPNLKYHYLLVRGFIRRDQNKQIVGRSDSISLDSVKGFREQNRVAGFPTWVSPSNSSPLALSPSIVSTRGERTREAAICINGGLFVVGGTEQSIRSLGLQATGREEAIVYGREGKEIYCLHSQPDNKGLRVTRVDNQAWKQTHSLALPREEVIELTTDVRQKAPGDLYKTSRAATMVRTADNKFLFVSHGRSIYKIDAATMLLHETFKVDLPCRVFHVWWGKPTPDSHVMYGSPGSCILLYAIGASYTGDGTTAKGNQFKTRFYKLAIPD